MGRGGGKGKPCCGDWALLERGRLHKVRWLVRVGRVASSKYFRTLHTKLYFEVYLRKTKYSLCPVSFDYFVSPQEY